MTLLTQEYKEHWSSFHKIAFRALFLYFILYIALMLISPLFEVPLRWIGQKLFKINYEYSTSGNGSGDNTFAYLTLFATFVLTLLYTIIWGLIDRKSKNYNDLFYCFIAYLRVVLILVMLLYGFAKVFKLQFPSASLSHLLDPLSDFSPMGLAWTYMGFSKSFNVFIGLVEVIGGLLLIPRKTQTLGALIIIGAMTQVAMMNFCYDIPVKLFSVHLILMALVILLTDNRFLKVFIENKAVTEYKYYHPIKNKEYHKAIFWVKSIGLSIVIVLMSFFFYRSEKKREDNGKNLPLYGIWETSSFVLNGDTLAPLITDNFRWRYLIVELKNRATVKTMDDAKHQFEFKVDSLAKEVTIHKKDPKSEDNLFNYDDSKHGILQLNGVLDSDTLNIVFRKIDHQKFNLNARGFNWINERPYNR